MTDTERIQQLEAENHGLRQQIEALQTQVKELLQRLGKDSHNSSKPPSSDGYCRRQRTRPPTNKKPGGQPGHEGHTLERPRTPAHVVVHRPEHCTECHQSLAGLPTQAQQTRQVLDLPPLCLEATDPVVETVACPRCGATTTSPFPLGVTAPVQDGPHLQAVAVYLHEEHLLPCARTCEVIADLWGTAISEGSLDQWVQHASQHLASFEAHLTAAVGQAAVMHGDETGVRIGGKLHWLHVASTTTLTLLRWHRKRGHQATDAFGVWPQFHGVAVHDRWSPYWRYPCQHALCHAHLQRELTALTEQGEEWAARLATVFQQMYAAVASARQHDRWLTLPEQDHWTRRFDALLNGGFAAHPPTPVPKQRGRPKQSPGKNLLDALHRHADAVLAFLTDPCVPLTNNQAERDLRMAKVQQKISGTFRSSAGATAFCRIRSLLGTARKQGFALLPMLVAVIQDAPLTFSLP